MDDAPPVQVQQPGSRINRHGQPAPPRQLGCCCCLLAASGQAVVQAALAAVLCQGSWVGSKVVGWPVGGACIRAAHQPATMPPGHLPVIRAGGTATNPMNWTMLHGARPESGLVAQQSNQQFSNANSGDGRLPLCYTHRAEPPSPLTWGGACGSSLLLPPAARAAPGPAAAAGRCQCHLRH